MADITNIIHLATYPRDLDPAAEAKQRLDSAGEDDAVYDQAMYDLMTLPATTIAGVRGKMVALQSWLIFAENGDEVSPGLWGEVRQCGDQIDEALARLT